MESEYVMNTEYREVLFQFVLRSYTGHDCGLTHFHSEMFLFTNQTRYQRALKISLFIARIYIIHFNNDITHSW